MADAQAQSDGPAPRRFISIVARFLRLVLVNDPLSRVLKLVLIVAFFMVFLYYWFPREQSFIVFAETKSLSVVTDRNPELLWELPEATLCVALPVDVAQARIFEGRRTEPVGTRSDQCDPLAFESPEALTDVDIEWPEGVGINLTLQNRNTIELLLVTSEARSTLSINGQTITDNSLLRFPISTMDENGLLILSGDVALGENAIMGANHLLQSGRYEIRENFLFRTRLQLVNEGVLTVGDKVTVRGAKKNLPVSARLFFTRSEQHPNLLNAVLTTQPARSALTIRRADQLAIIEPNWIERLKSDAWPIVMTTLLGLFGASLGIVHSFRSLNARPSGK